jgi:arylsulfatase A-like enzyme
LHTLEVHEYERPMFENGPPGETPYDRAVRYQDEALRELLDEYRRRERDLILVLLSDHGEGFGEYGIKVGHGYSLRQNQLHIPLVFHGPEWLPRGRSTHPASIVDVAPTLLDLFSLPPLPHAQGRSLLPDSFDRELSGAVYAERTWFLWDHQGPALVARVAADGSKLVEGHPQPLSWDLTTSPCEDQRHQRPVRPDAAADLRRFVEAQRQAQSWWEAAYGTSTIGTLDAGDVARLRALGYLE